MTEADATARASELQEEIQSHKAAIGHHRRQLRASAAALARFEADCRRAGIRIVLVPKRTSAGEGGVHGRIENHPTA